MREKFEEWIPAQFPDFKIDLLARSHDGSYENELINTLWVGFCAGYLLAANK